MPGISRWCCPNFRLFLWDSRRKLLCKRAAPEWGQFCMYYLGFFLILMSLTAFMCIIIIHYVQRYQTTFFDVNHLGGTPSVSMRPVATKQLIIYRLQDVQMAPSSYINDFKNLLQAYQNQDNKTHQECTSTCLNSAKPCKFNISSLGPCGKEPYGYDTESPCVLIKLNKHFGWFPCLPPNDPSRQSQQSYIEVECKGHQPADREHYSELHLYPQNGFPTSFFPYSAQKHYLAPLVAVKIENPLSGILVTIECTSRYEGKAVSSLIFQVIVVGR
ncbi:hypothetical protein R5R35_008411 [Gryllus longicercus]|uniref:Uncharacterized protein n=1 Tax=Gryllus longicercus TaxID=2509291 RepID=A0AAN9W214_9ORTH